MQSIERSMVLSKKSPEDQLKYCLLLEAGEVLRNLVHATKEKCHEYALALPQKYRESLFQNDSSSFHDSNNKKICPIDTKYDAIKDALSKCNTDTVCTIIGDNISHRKAKSFSSLSKEYLSFYCVLLGLVESPMKMSKSKDGMICILTSFFYSKLWDKYIRIRQPDCERQCVKPKEHENFEIAHNKALLQSETGKRSIESQIQSNGPCRPPYPKNSASEKISTKAFDSRIMNTHEKEFFSISKNHLIGKYATYFEEALAFSPVLPIDSILKFVEERTGTAAKKEELEYVASKLHDMMQIVYASDQGMLYLV